MTANGTHPSPASARSAWRTALLLALILLLALGLRVWRLDQHALWWDEGNNAYFAHASPARLLEMSRLTHDTNPPVHRLALGLWLTLLGDSAANLRLLSVLCGALTVGLAFHWGRRLAGDRAGLLAALLLALSPAAIGYSREAKGYPWITLFEWIGLTLLIPLVEPPARPRRRATTLLLWACYVFASALAVGAHYYALFVHLAQGVWLIAGVLRPWRGWREAARRLWPWALAQVAVLALVAPWTLLTWRTAYPGAAAIPLEQNASDLGAYVTAMLTRLAGGLRVAPGWGWLAALALLIPAAWAVWRGRGADRVGRHSLLACLIGVPLAAGYLVQCAGVIVIPRLFLYVVPALCILAAAGLARLGRRALPLGLALALAWGLSLPGAYAAPAPPEEDIRGLAATLDALARPGDAAVVSYIWQEGMLRMYAPRADLDWRLGWFTDEDVASAMEALLGAHARLWLMSYDLPLQHPSNGAGWWLEQHAVRALTQEQGRNRLTLYVRDCSSAGSSFRALFGDNISLYDMPPPPQAAPGDVLSLPLSWELAEPVPEALTVFVQLLGPDGALVAQADGDPRNGLAPLAGLARGESLSECRALLVPAEAAPGAYTVIAGLYDRETGVRVPLTSDGGTAADHALLGTVVIAGGDGAAD